MTTLSPEEAEPAPAPGSAPPAQPSPDPTSVPAVCSVCQQPFPSRNALFRHLRETCLPQLPAAGAREGRAQQLVALLCGYVGHQFHGSYRTAREDEDARPTVEGAVVRAVEAAWGTSVCSITQAVRTERKASAARNVIVVGLNPAVRPEAAALREALPPSVTLLAAPLPMALKMGDLTRVVRSQAHTVAIPYAALLPPGADPEPEHSDRVLWLSGFPADAGTPEVETILRDARVEGRCSLVPECGGWVEVSLEAGAMARALDALDGREWRGRPLTALPASEARAKMRVHQRMKGLLRRISGGHHFHNFLAGGAGVTQRYMQRCSSGWQVDIRPLGARPARQWVRQDWCLVRFSAKHFGREQVRRVAGVLLAIVRGAEDDAYLDRCFTQKDVATPIVPAEATWLETFLLRSENEALLPPEDPAAVEAVRTALRTAVVAAAAAPFAALVRELDSGHATRARDDGRLRAAAAAGDTGQVAACLAEGARVDALDEYGRSALFVAAHEGHGAVVAELLAQGAAPGLPAHGGCTPAQAAAAAGHAAVVQQLREAEAQQTPTDTPDDDDDDDDGNGGANGTVAGAPAGPPRHDRTGLAAALRALGGAPVVTDLIADATHPGAGSTLVDGLLPDAAVDALLALWRTLPTAPKDKPSPIDRAYYADVEALLSDFVAAAVAASGLGEASHVHPLVRFLHYTEPGGSLPAHVDLSRVVARTGERTTHSFLLYLTDTRNGGETLLLSARDGDPELADKGGCAPGDRDVLARSQPRRGRLMLMPHACPHLAAPLGPDSEKLLIRGEVLVAP